MCVSLLNRLSEMVDKSARETSKHFQVVGWSSSKIHYLDICGKFAALLGLELLLLYCVNGYLTWRKFLKKCVQTIRFLNGQESVKD